MRLSKYLLGTLREAPADADVLSAQLMFRAGMIRKVASGIYDWLPLGLRVLKKVERIVREEMDAISGQEVWLPTIQPKELWVETGRWGVYGKELLRIEDRKEAEFCYAPTAEEVVTDLIRREVRSWRQLPVLLYQFGSKFRDEIRPRFGVMRAREFYMKDAYSFHPDEKDAERVYGEVFDAYSRVFKRCGLQFRPVEAEAGPIGGSYSHEFMVLAHTGENEIASCAGCAYTANVERAEIRTPEISDAFAPQDLKLVPTPGATTVEDVAKLLKTQPKRFIKLLAYKADGKPALALVRGDHELNEFKLMHALKAESLEKATEDEYRAFTGSPVGFAGPQGEVAKVLRKELGVRLLADNALKGPSNMFAGGNEADQHAANVNLGRDWEPDAFADLRVARAGDLCPRCGKPFELFRGIEVGHTFKLGDKYSKALKAVYLDPEQKERVIYMGCYGIGVSRVVAAAIEQAHDDNGIIWPLALAPFQVVVLPTDVKNERVRAEAEAVYEHLRGRGADVALDDRDERPGVKFKDADLIGVPIRVTVSPKTLEHGALELKERREKEPRVLPREEALRLMEDMLSGRVPA